MLTPTIENYKYAQYIREPAAFVVDSKHLSCKRRENIAICEVYNTLPSSCRVYEL